MGKSHEFSTLQAEALALRLAVETALQKENKMVYLEGDAKELI